MSDLSGESPHAVAYRLMEIIAATEGKRLGSPDGGPDKQWVLQTYKECINSVLCISRWGAWGN